MPTDDQTTEFLVAPEHAGERLDVYVSRMKPDLSRREARRACQRGLVRVNGKRNRAGYIIRAAERVTMDAGVGKVLPRPELVDRESLERYVRVLNEREHYLVLDKARGVPSVVLTSADPVTVADCLTFLDSAAPGHSPDPREAGLVQRLDTLTSGLLLAARSPEAWALLRKSFEQDQVEKHYWALVCGWPKRDRWQQQGWLVPCDKGRRTRLSGEETTGAQWSESSLRVLVRNSGPKRFALVEVRGKSMRRHQVRAHLAEAGFPLVGDKLYDAPDSLDALLAHHGLAALGEGFLLHATQLSFEDPWTARPETFCSDNPILKELHKQWTRKA